MRQEDGQDGRDVCHVLWSPFFCSGAMPDWVYIYYFATAQTIGVRNKVIATHRTTIAEKEAPMSLLPVRLSAGAIPC